MSDLVFSKSSIDFKSLYSISLSTELLKNIRRIDQGFPHIGVCPWLVPHLVSSCLGLSFVVYVYVLSAFYYHVDVIANLNIVIGLI